MKLDFDKMNHLIPVVIQDNTTLQVLMLGYMNEEALQQTEQTGRVTFYSRSKQRLWTKGETSGNFLEVCSITADCDQDALVIKVKPNGPVCHTGEISCFKADKSEGFIYQLQQIIQNKIQTAEQGSYTHTLVNSGINKVAQKVGEEAVELVIEAMRNDKEAFTNEAADLLYHYLVLLAANGMSIVDIEKKLLSRHK